MGPMLMTGLITFGTAIAIGLIGSAAADVATSSANARAIRSARGILFAFCAGLGVLGTIVGLLAIFILPLSDPAAAPFVGVPAVVGAAAGLGLIARSPHDGGWPVRAIYNVVGQGILGLVVAMLAILIATKPPGHVNDLVFVLLALVGAASALAVGVVSRRAIESMRGADEATIKAILRASLVPIQLRQAAGVVAVAVASIRWGTSGRQSSTVR